MSKFKKRSKPEKTGECLEDYDDVIRLGNLVNYARTSSTVCDKSRKKTYNDS